MISVVIVTYRTGPPLKDCVEAVLRQPETGDVVIVDNGNDAAARLYLASLCDPRVRVERMDRNIGFAAACNHGASLSRGDFVALVNPDLTVSDGAFGAVLRALAAHPEAWACGGRLLDADGREQRGGRREILTPWRVFAEILRLERLFPGHPHFRRLNMHQAPPVAGTVEVPAISGAFMVLPMTRWRALGGMDAGYFLHVEDMDLCLRIHRAGGTILYCGDAPLHHRQGTSDAARCVVEWRKTVSAARYFRKHFPEAYPAWVIRVVIALMWLRFMGVCLRYSIGDAVQARRRRAAYQR